MSRPDLVGGVKDLKVCQILFSVFNLESVSVPLKHVVDCMFLAAELAGDFERWE